MKVLADPRILDDVARSTVELDRAAHDRAIGIDEVAGPPCGLGSEKCRRCSPASKKPFMYVSSGRCQFLMLMSPQLTWLEYSSR